MGTPMARDSTPADDVLPASLPGDNLVPLEAILCTDELKRRPFRPPDYETENRALAALVQVLADAPQTILQTLADTLLDVFKADSAGMSLLTDDGTRFSWPAIAGAWRPHLGDGTPRDFGPCGDVLDCNAPLLFKHWERRYPYLLETMPLAHEGLLVPFYVEGKAVGTIWTIAHDDRRKFDAEDLRQLESLSRFASAAYQAVERRQVELRQQLLIDELNHRVKNTLATVQSIAAHTLTAPSDVESRRTFDARLIALSRTHDLLARGSWEGASLRELLLQELDPFQSVDGTRFVVEGPDIELRPKAVLALGLAFHELAANAAKYGALSTRGGQVRVAWGVQEASKPGALRLRWAETGGPRVEKTGHKGFGLILIERGLSLELDGEIALDLHPEGLVCAMKIPLPGRKAADAG
jgi:two-component sensor histidine kinase